jgi:hypothetical protein
MFKPTLFFGYGSLLKPRGINGRGMRYQYKEEDLILARLSGYERSMCGYFGQRNFYGLLPVRDASCNGIVFQIHTWRDYRALLTNEGATAMYKFSRTYWPMDVTHLTKGMTVPKGYRVIALACREDNTGKGRVELSYIGFCWQLAQRWGDEFAKEFLRTGGIEFNKEKLIADNRAGKIKLW